MIQSVMQHGAAHQGGLSAGDVLVAIDGLRVNASNLEELLSRYHTKQKALVHVFRRDELRSFTVEFNTPLYAEFQLQPKKDRLTTAAPAVKVEDTSEQMPSQVESEQ